MDIITSDIRIFNAQIKVKITLDFLTKNTLENTIRDLA